MTDSPTAEDIAKRLNMGGHMADDTEGETPPDMEHEETPLAQAERHLEAMRRQRDEAMQKLDDMVRQQEARRDVDAVEWQQGGSFPGAHEMDPMPEQQTPVPGRRRRPVVTVQECPEIGQMVLYAPNRDRKSLVPAMCTQHRDVPDMGQGDAELLVVLFVFKHGAPDVMLEWPIPRRFKGQLHAVATLTTAD